MKHRNPLKLMSSECVYARFFFYFPYFSVSFVLVSGFCHIQSNCSIFICTQYISLFEIIAWLLLSLYFLNVFFCTMCTTDMTDTIFFFIQFFNSSIYLISYNGSFAISAFTVDIFTFPIIICYFILKAQF